MIRTVQISTMVNGIILFFYAVKERYVYFDKSSIHNFFCNDSVYTTSPLRIGVNGVRNEGYFSGCIDEIKIVKSAWTQAQIDAEYERCF
jgi:hypothetical protein